MPTIGAPQRICGYRREGQQDNVTYVHEEYAMRLVLGENLDEILKHHRSGEMCVCPVLEYSAKRGRHKITQALVAEGITVTREAIKGAAKLGGAGVDLLLAGVRDGEALEMARHDALHARLYYGEFPRAMDLLDAGVLPSAECYGALEEGAKRAGKDEWKLRCHPMLDAMLPLTRIEQFTPDTLDVILNAGRPIHVERTLEILKRPPLFLYVTALVRRADDAVVTLRHLGLRMNDDAFVQVSAELCGNRFAYRLNLQPLFDLYVEDSGQAMPAKVAEPLLLTILRDREWSLRKIDGPNDASYQIAREVLLPIMNCMDPEEHLQLSNVIDRWATNYGVVLKIPVTVTAVLKHTIQAAHRVAMEQIVDEAPSP